MALSGIHIYKFLPKTNCKKCDFPTCLAFAMKLASGQVELAKCPDVSEEAKQSLDAASRPPMRLVTIGNGDKGYSIGGETVLFRHDKTFFHPAALLLRIKDTVSADEAAKQAEQVHNYTVDRVGMSFSMDGIAVQNESGDAATFVACIQAIKSKTDLPLILMATDPAVMGAALEQAADGRPAIYAATKDNIDQMIELAKKHNVPLAIRSENGLDELAELSEKAQAAGLEDLILDPGTRDFGDSLVTLTQMRRLAIKQAFRPMGYPAITFPGETASTVNEETLLAGQYIAKYGSIVVLDHFLEASIYPLITLRLNIYTDPQKPIQMEPGIYTIGEAKDDSPICVTTNFSLTYFSIAGELESSGWPTWLVVCDTEGLSVLTAWSAGKFDAEKIAKTINEHDVASKVKHKRLILPGKVAVLRGELEDELPGWEILIGTPEAMDIGGYLKQIWPNT